MRSFTRTRSGEIVSRNDYTFSRHWNGDAVLIEGEVQHLAMSPDLLSPFLGLTGKDRLVLRGTKPTGPWTIEAGETVVVIMPMIHHDDLMQS